MRVLCISGHPGILEEGEIYTVKEETERGSYLLFEVDPPQPYLSFRRERFVPLSNVPEEELMDLELLSGGYQA